MCACRALSSLVPQHALCSERGGKRMCPVPGDGKGWRWGQFLPARFGVACGDEQEFFAGNPAPNTFSLTLLLHHC